MRLPRINSPKAWTCPIGGADAFDRLRKHQSEEAELLFARVRRGARLLDWATPGWYRSLELDKLAMETCDRCVLGQLHGDFREGFKIILARKPSWRAYSAAHNGFTLHDDEQDHFWHPRAIELVQLRFDALGSLWRREVKKRLMGETR